MQKILFILSILLLLGNTIAAQQISAADKAKMQEFLTPSEISPLDVNVLDSDDNYIYFQDELIKKYKDSLLAALKVPGWGAYKNKIENPKVLKRVKKIIQGLYDTKNVTLQEEAIYMSLSLKVKHITKEELVRLQTVTDADNNSGWVQNQPALLILGACLSPKKGNDLIDKYFSTGSANGRTYEDILRLPLGKEKELLLIKARLGDTTALNSYMRGNGINKNRWDVYEQASEALCYTRNRVAIDRVIAELLASESNSQKAQTLLFSLRHCIYNLPVPNVFSSFQYSEKDVAVAINWLKKNKNTYRINKEYIY
jgi:hypothetical protein